LLDSAGVAGFCYTQLTDTDQERNGVVTADRQPKIDPAHRGCEWSAERVDLHHFRKSAFRPFASCSPRRSASGALSTRCQAVTSGA
jgi:hypothetical protein